MPLLSLNLIGQGNSCQVTLSETIVNFEGDLYIGQEYKRKVRLEKEYQGIVYYKLGLDSKTSDQVDVDILAQGRRLSNKKNAIEG